jgi:acyl transferase domain-containing protein
MNEHVEGSDLAVIGMAGRFPGAPNLEVFWRNLRDGVSSVRILTDEELLAAGESPALLRDPAYVRACPVLADLEMFDAGFFGWTPRDAAITDPQHRLFLETAWEAFEDAGYDVEAHPGPVGVFASCGMNSYMMYHLVTNPEVMETVGEWLVRHTGNDANFLATRVSYELNLRGPSMTVQTACSSSLVAIHAACQSLLHGECDLALAGGSTVLLPRRRGYLFKEGEILSPDGRCRPFDARAAGTVLGSGAGCVVLERLADALANGDQILAVIKGSAVNNDGSQKVGYLAPSVEGQRSAVAEALALTGVDPESISYVEAHGTGTSIGDPIEVAALTQAYGAGTDRTGFCALGSLKSNIGHLGEAAGVAGFIKTVLSLRNRQLPPTLHYERPNPEIDFAGSPFFVNARLTEWRTAARSPRRAGVTALGAGGTNVHMIVEEAPSPAPPTASRAFQVVLLSAKTATALEAATTNLAEHLEQNPDILLPDVAYTLEVGRKAFAHRRFLLCRSGEPSEAAAALLARDPRRVFTQAAPRGNPSVVFMFPGGGAQYAGMGADLYATEPVYREAIDQCVKLVNPGLGLDLRRLMFAPPDELEAAARRLERPSLALPALFATEYALARLLMSWGVRPAAMIGHSMGEYVAACLSGVISYQSGMALVALRGRLFETLPEGGMLGAPLPEAEARACLGEALSLAAINGPSLCVASGPAAAIAALEAALAGRGVESTRVHIAVAAHSAMLDPILGEFERFCRTIPWKPPELPFVSNLTGAWITAAEATDPRYWALHLRSTVRFADGLAALAVREPDRLLVEVGPGRTLSSLAQQQPVRARAALSTLRHPQAEGSDVAFLLTTLGRMWLAGASPDWSLFHAGAGRRRLSLPTYPFERRRHWIEAGAPITVERKRDPSLRKRPDIADWFYLPSWRRSLPPAAPLPAADSQRGSFLLFTDACGLGAALARRLPGAVTVSVGERFGRIGDDAYALNPGSRADYDALLEDLKARGRHPGRIVHLWAVSAGASLPFEQAQELYFESLLLLAQALLPDERPFELTVVSSGLRHVAGDPSLQPEKALLVGPCQVIPREFPHVLARSVDVALPLAGSWQEARLHDQLLAELWASPAEGVVAYRGADRWVQTFEPTRLGAPAGRGWLRERGVYLITGGLGGIGLELAEHLARAARARLVLVGRAALPPRDAWASFLASHDPSHGTSCKIRRVQAIEALGAEVVAESADVTSREQMSAVVARARARFGAVHGVVHAAGTIDDGLMVLKTPQEARSVIAPKVVGALVLDAVLAGSPLDFFVLFSSVSSILGLPGQADYTAGNAFLDAFAQQRAARDPSRTVAINWSAWRDVGMVVAIAAQAAQRAAPPGPTRETGHPLLERHVAGSSDHVFITAFDQRKQWLLSEHVIRGAEAVIPGTGYLELARAALEEIAAPAPRPRAVELRDVFFVAPFAVSPGETRELRLTLRHATSEFVITSTPPGASTAGPAQVVTHVTGAVSHVDMPPPRRLDIEEIRLRCAEREEILNGFMKQEFLDFGRRWANLESIRYGRAEALVTLELPADLAEELDTLRLHPALLDMATGAAQGLIPGFDPRRDFFVPFSYGRLLLRGGLPRRLVSHVRLAEGSRDGLAVFDVTLLDERGSEVAQISDFVMKRVKGRSAMAGPPALALDGRPRHAAASALAVFREGILAPEGMDAFDRILGSRVSPSIVVSSIDLHGWIAQTDAIVRPASGAKDEARASTPRGGRPSMSQPYVAPRDELEQRIADIWQTMLGVEEVGIHDDFFEIGGHSLLLTQTVTRVRKMVEVEIPLRSLFAKPTIAEIAEGIRRAKAGPDPRAAPALAAVSRDAYRVKRAAVADPLSGKKHNTV